MSKYYIEVPIPIKCNLRCYYCFHAKKWECDQRKEKRLSPLKSRRKDYPDTAPFTPSDLKQWIAKHLSDATEILYELHGGEPSCAPKEVFEMIDTLENGRFQIQTNGLGSLKFYENIANRKDKIDRVGFTYHRAMIKSDTAKQKKFEQNLKLLQQAGLKVYVKELLIPEFRSELLNAKAYWEGKGIEYRIQDFKGCLGQKTPSVAKEDVAMVHEEYQHTAPVCECRKGYQQLLIRGYDMMRGDVIACWHDPVVVGSITEDWYKGGYTVNRRLFDPCREGIGIADTSPCNVVGVPKKYRSTVYTDKYDNFNHKFSVREDGMSRASEHAKERITYYRQKLDSAKQEHDAYSKRVEELAVAIENVKGMLVAYEDVVRVGEEERKEFLSRPPSDLLSEVEQEEEKQDKEQPHEH